METIEITNAIYKVKQPSLWKRVKQFIKRMKDKFYKHLSDGWDWVQED